MADDRGKSRPWLWPDRTIGKRESRRLREEHNETVNQHADMLAALQECEAWFNHPAIRTTMIKLGEQSTFHKLQSNRRRAIRKATEEGG